MGKKKTVAPKKRNVPLKSVTAAEQNPASVDEEAFAQVLRKRSRPKKK